VHHQQPNEFLKITSGIRIGTPAVTTRGFGEKECRELASMICDICDELDNQSVIDSVRTQFLL
jgi:glycine hydroxymethyltransferase